MTSEPYLAQLTARLADGLSRLEEDHRQLHVDYLLSLQNSDGGFPDREGGSDLYYTGFALRSLAVLDALTPEICDRTIPFLRRCMQTQTSVVDFFSFLYSCLLIQASTGTDVLAGAPSDWPDRVAATLESFRTPDGGYAKGPRPANAPVNATAGSGSTYHSFLVTLCYQLLGRDVPDPESLVRFVLSRRRDDGGFVEIAAMRRSGTNPTAAGVGLLQIIDPGVFDRQPEVRQGVIDLFAEMPSFEGGLRANNRVPVADLLSSFTGSWTMSQLNALDRLETDRILEFAQSVEQPAGGFCGGVWDEKADAEYTFYGLGILGLFA